MFDDTKVQSVFEDFQARLDQELPKLMAMVAEGQNAKQLEVDEFLLAVGPDVGRFIHSLILAKKPKRILEVGTSYGYSTLFLADAARKVGAKVTTMEIAENKLQYAKKQIEKAGLLDVVEFRLGDAIANIEADTGLFDLALIDIWKTFYVTAFEALYPKLSAEGIVLSDNMIMPPDARKSARALRKAISDKPDMHTTLLSIGSGIELSCRWPSGNDNL